MLLQYEVECCDIASDNAGIMASAFTVLSITASTIPHVALSGQSNVPGWQAVSSVGCLDLKGNAYKCMDGIPSANALNATADLNNAEPCFIAYPNIGFVFRPEDLPGQAGGIVGFGDVNMYYESAGEPPNNGGIQPVDISPVELIFGTPSSKCSLLPLGCLSTGQPERPSTLLGTIFPNPADEHLTLQADVQALVDITVFNSLGQLVLSQRASGAPLITIPTGQLASGAYHLLLRQGGKQEAATFTVEH